MKIYILFLLLVVSARASNVLLFDPASTPVAGQAVAYIRAVDTPQYSGNANALINPVLPAGVALNDLKVTGGVAVEMSGAEKAAVAAALAAKLAALFKSAGLVNIDGTDPQSRLMRAMVDVLVTQINILRTSPTTVFAAVTPAQVKAALQASINSQP